MADQELRQLERAARYDPAFGSVPATPLNAFSAPSHNVFGATSLASARAAVYAAEAAFAARVAALAAKAKAV